jgi:hypothetical protein
MKKQILVVVLISIFSIQSYAQLNFEKGYFIDESDNRVECLIKNNDWKNNPKEFRYKLTQNDEDQQATIQTIKEFGVYDEFKYIKAKIDIDRSSDIVSKLSDKKEPVFEEEVLFLKVLIEGKASLYQYYEDNLKRYFYKLDDAEIKQLVYKRYAVYDYNNKTIAANVILKNNTYKQQLLKNLSCETTDINDYRRLRYAKSDLKKMIIAYNNCKGADYVNYELNQNKIKINLNLRPGINNSAFEIKDLTELRNTDFGSNTSFRFGIEAEFLLPTNNNRWGLIIEPTYRSYESEVTKEASNVSGGIFISRMDYRSIELPVGARHYFNLSEKSKIFVNVSYVFDFDFDSKVEFFRGDNSLLPLSTLEIETLNFAIGVGYKYNDKFGIEFRYFTNESILKGLDSSVSEFNTISVIFGYTLF